MTMRQSQAETRRQNVAKRSMTKEAKQLSSLIAGLRKSLDGIHKERTSTKLTGAEMGMLDERRNNLLLTIAAFLFANVRITGGFLTPAFFAAPMSNGESPT